MEIDFYITQLKAIVENGGSGKYVRADSFLLALEAIKKDIQGK